MINRAVFLARNETEHNGCGRTSKAADAVSFRPNTSVPSTYRPAGSCSSIRRPFSTRSDQRLVGSVAKLNVGDDGDISSSGKPFSLEHKFRKSGPVSRRFPFIALFNSVVLKERFMGEHFRHHVISLSHEGGGVRNLFFHQHKLLIWLQALTEPEAALKRNFLLRDLKNRGTHTSPSGGDDLLTGLGGECVVGLGGSPGNGAERLPYLLVEVHLAVPGAVDEGGDLVPRELLRVLGVRDRDR